MKLFKKWKKNIKRQEKIYGLEKRRKSGDIPNYETIKPSVNMENLKFYNGFGGFSDDRKRICDKNK